MPEQNDKPIFDPSLLPADVVRLLSHWLPLKDFKNYRLTCRFFARSTYPNLRSMLLDGVTVSAISTAACHTLFLMKDGSVWATGSSLGGHDASRMPIRLPGLISQTQVLASFDLSYFLEKGRVTSRGSKENLCDTDTAPLLTTICQVATTCWDTYFLRADGSVIVKGKNYNGQLGIGEEEKEVPLMLHPTLADICQICAVGTHSFFVKKDGTVLACGDVGGVLATGSNQKNILVPALVSTVKDICKVVSSAHHALYLSKTGQVYASGCNEEGQLGMGNKESCWFPTLIPHLNNVVDIAVGTLFSVFLLKNGEVFVCGSNENGQLGLNGVVKQLTPKLVLSNVKQITAWANHAIYLTNDNKLFATGSNEFGQLGLGDTAQRFVPEEIKTFANAREEIGKRDSERKQFYSKLTPL